MSHVSATLAATCISGPALPPDSARLRFKGMVANGYISTRERSSTDGRGTLLFGDGDVLTAAILSQLMDLGGLSRETMQAAALRLQNWLPGEVPTITPEQGAMLQKLADEGKPMVLSGYEKPPENPCAWMLDVYRRDVTTPPDFSLRLSWQKHVSGAIMCKAAILHGDNGFIGQGLLTQPDHFPVADLILAIDPILLETHVRIERLKTAH